VLLPATTGVVFTFLGLIFLLSNLESCEICCVIMQSGEGRFCGVVVGNKTFPSTDGKQRGVTVTTREAAAMRRRRRRRRHRRRRSGTRD